MEKVDGKDTIIMQKIIVEPYGFLTQEKKIEGIEYEVVTGNVICSIAFSCALVVPVYLCGWKLYEPVGLEKEGIKIAPTHLEQK